MMVLWGKNALSRRLPVAARASFAKPSRRSAPRRAASSRPPRACARDSSASRTSGAGRANPGYPTTRGARSVVRRPAGPGQCSRAATPTTPMRARRAPSRARRRICGQRSRLEWLLTSFESIVDVRCLARALFPSCARESRSKPFKCKTFLEENVHASVGFTIVRLSSPSP